MTEEQERALLLAIYDYVAAVSPLWDAALDDLERGASADQEWLDRNFGHTSYDWVTALQRILTPDQIRLWYQHCAGCARRLSSRQYEDPILRLEGAP